MCYETYSMSTYNRVSWARSEIFVGGGGRKPKKGLHHEVKIAKRQTHGEKAPKHEKNIANKPLYKEKVAKRPPI